jgi:NADPH:quinone reductase-like Zn-dependent oxidoreductase
MNRTAARHVSPPADAALPDAMSTTYLAYSLPRGAGLGALQASSRASPALRRDEVRVRVHAVALNHRDLMFADGRSGQGGAPVVPASDGAGEVIEVGADVRALRVGDRVVGSFFPDWIDGAPTPAQLQRALGGSVDGMLAQQVILPETAWVPIPDGVGYPAAATVPCAGVTAWHALFGIGALPPGASVALLGTGGVSLWALDLAKAAGLRVVLTSSDDAKLELARARGADATINYRRHPEWAQELLRLSDGVGVDRVLDIGGPDTLAQSIAALRLGGTVAVIGRLTGAAPAQFDPAALFAGMKKLAGVMVGSAAMSRELLAFMARHRLQPAIDREFGFGQAAQAYAHLASAAHFGKVVIRLAS